MEIRQAATTIEEASTRNFLVNGSTFFMVANTEITEWLHKNYSNKCEIQSMKVKTITFL